MKDRAVLAVLAGLVLAVVAGILPAAEGLLLWTFPSGVAHRLEAFVLLPEGFGQFAWGATEIGLEICLAVGTIAGIRGVRRDGFTRRTRGLLACALVVSGIVCVVPLGLYLRMKRTAGTMDEASPEGLAYMRSHLEHPAGLASGDRQEVHRLWHDYAQDAYVWSGRVVQIPQDNGTIRAFQPAESDDRLQTIMAAMRSRLHPIRNTAIFAARFFVYLLLAFLTKV